MKTPFYITTPIYYVNAKPHLGHAYTTVLADVLARFHKLFGQKVFFITGTDEHGDKIVKAAAANKLTPNIYVDEISALFQNAWPKLSIETDRFIRTTSAKHKKIVQDILQKVYDKGDIYFAEYGGHYCFGCERFYADKELIDGKCPDHQTIPEYIKEKNYFFRMSKYLPQLAQLLEENPQLIQPEQYLHETLGLLREDLGDLCISRPKTRLNWGIDLPFDNNFVTYVWFDALFSYISAFDGSSDNFQEFWHEATHLIGKDILKPHAIFWPTILLAAELPVYKKLLVHGHWKVCDTKMSKSIGNVVEPQDMVDKFGVDQFRYFLMREMTFGSDSSFSEDAIIARINFDLANDFGNLVSRVLSMVHKYNAGKIPKIGSFGAAENEVVICAKDVFVRYTQAFDAVMPSKALAILWELIAKMNKYIDVSAPWNLYKTNDVHLFTVLRFALEIVRKIALFAWPVMPSSCEKILIMLGISKPVFDIHLADECDNWQMLATDGFIQKVETLFPRQEISKEINMPESAKLKKDEEKKYIEFDDFKKINMQLGTILEASKVEKSDKLLKLIIDLGEERPRQIISGIADFYAPEILIGKQVVVVTNLAPRKLRGLESEGMVLAVKDETGLQLLSLDKKMHAGTIVS